MLVDFTPTEIAMGKNMYSKDIPALSSLADSFLFADSYERQAEGIYEINHYFSILGRDLIKDEYAFGNVAADAMRRSFDAADELGEDYYGSALHKSHLEEVEWIMENYTSYGVCDYPEQVAERYPSLKSDSRRLIVAVRRIKQDDGSDWRWHKWGTYIGTRTPQAEYLKDEVEGFGDVFVYRIMELHSLDEIA